jgi:hypothetical protein
MKTVLSLVTPSAQTERPDSIPHIRQVMRLTNALRDCMDELDRLDLGPAAVHVGRALTDLRLMLERREAK